ncbi:MAG TPA: class I SAM-dependent methyltransferase [Candidatus Pacearchaeota archaeon]|nr:class I SAM-dependent methyltransferase [Candidatus Pacearchaeota archaeon]
MKIKVDLIKRALKRVLRGCLHKFSIDIYKYNGLSPMENYVNKHTNGKLVGVEIGVYKGINAEKILKGMNIETLYLIDPYLLYGKYVEGFSMYDSHKNLIGIEQKMLRKIRHYKDKYIIIKKMSADAIKDIPHNLDFVYVDGNHSYKYVLEDIELYYKKLKQGGIIGGDDFDHEYLPEVKNAVMDFVNKHKLQLNVKLQDWWVTKGQGRKKNFRLRGK